MGLTIYIIRRLLLLIPIWLGVTLFTFAIIHLTPGDPVALMLGTHATPERADEIREQLGLNAPLLTQYVHYLGNLVQGHLGYSFRGQTPVLDEILIRWPSTLQLTLTAMGLATLIGVSAGVIAATARNPWIDGLIMGSALIGLSIPHFWLAILLILIFGVHLGWISVTGAEGLTDLILPSICLAIPTAAVLVRVTRTSMLEVLSEDYICTARAKGLVEQMVILRHGLRNALIPVVTIMGLQFAGLLGGAVFIEAVFARPGLGRFVINAIANRDYPQIQGVVLFLTTIFMAVSLVIDVLYVILNPRIRYG
ncbi:MAG: ABC transporter permease [Chloroflexi bacterium AL-W]|nr:ABC transporter permease [Chloroflexi bacterium AL-N1]NOK67090.1 ABC transporter permease [Chloroflexi bacterium AL-N10]NOK74617.1 ABC transporter permease [Chloroflexi bacterium AL-N5]NOK81692.1 ABC transporter permease [Chloroflexi bacterium AL-W]NOK89162.1 ABC transporter permease [Chloroflexi bacterium AL-N15]